MLRCTQLPSVPDAHTRDTLLNGLTDSAIPKLETHDFGGHFCAIIDPRDKLDPNRLPCLDRLVFLVTKADIAHTNPISDKSPVGGGKMPSVELGCGEVQLETPSRKECCHEVSCQRAESA
jgi:hypothetical protein